MRKFMEENEGFMVISAAIILPLIFALAALSFDLGNALKNQSRLADSLREASLISGLNVDSQDDKYSKIEFLAKTYVGKDKEIKNIKMESFSADSSQVENVKSSFFRVSANIANNGVFTSFIDGSSNKKDIEVQSYAKAENIDNVGYTDYVFAMAFTDSATEDTSLNIEHAQKLCQIPDLISVGFCNPPLGSPKAIDAVQTMVANIIHHAKKMDRDNTQMFGFIPYGGGIQVKGRDLTPEARIDRKDGLSSSERDDSTYVVWPIEILTRPEFKDYDIYSRFYPKEYLQPHNPILVSKVFYRLHYDHKIDTTIFRSPPQLGEYMLKKFELSQENEFLSSNYSPADIQRAKEIITNIFDQQAVGDERIFQRHPENITRTINNLFTERENFIYRLYNPKYDRIILNNSKENLATAATSLGVIQAEYQGILEGINILREALRNSHLYVVPPDIVSPVLEHFDKIELELEAECKQANLNGSGNCWEGSDELNAVYMEKYGITNDDFLYNFKYEIEDNIRSNPDKANEVAKKAVTQFKLSVNTQASNEATGTGLIQNDMRIREYRRKIAQLENEIQTVRNQNRAILIFCDPSNLSSPFEAENYQRLCDSVLSSSSTSYEEVYKKIQDAQNELVQVQAQLRAYESFRNSLRGREDKTLAQLLAEEEAKRDDTLAQILHYEALLRNGFTIKGKGLCSSIASFILGAACQTKSAAALNFHEINLRKIDKKEDIKNIAPISEQPFDISEYGTYIEGVTQDKDYASMGLIRAAQMLAKSRSQNPNAKILVFSTTANSIDEKLFEAGLCQAIVNGIKERTGANVEIYAIALGLPTDDRRLISLSKYNRTWSNCTKNIITADRIDALFDKTIENVFKGNLGRISYDSLANN